MPYDPAVGDNIIATHPFMIDRFTVCQIAKLTPQKVAIHPVDRWGKVITTETSNLFGRDNIVGKLADDVSVEQAVNAIRDLHAGFEEAKKVATTAYKSGVRSLTVVDET